MQRHIERQHRALREPTQNEARPGDAEVALDRIEKRKNAASCVGESGRNFAGEVAWLTQLQRALVSTCLNLAEGAGRKTPSDQARMYQIAYGSLAEAMAAVQLLRSLGLGGESLVAAEQRLREAGALYFHLIRATSRSA